MLFEETNKKPLHLFRDYHTFDPLKPVTPQEQEHIIKTLRVLYKAQFHGLIQSKPQTIVEQQHSYPLARYTYALIQESKGTTQDKNIGVEDQIKMQEIGLSDIRKLECRNQQIEEFPGRSVMLLEGEQIPMEEAASSPLRTAPSTPPRSSGCTRARRCPSRPT